MSDLRLSTRADNSPPSAWDAMLSALRTTSTFLGLFGTVPIFASAAVLKGTVDAAINKAEAASTGLPLRRYDPDSPEERAFREERRAKLLATAREDLEKLATHAAITVEYLDDDFEEKEIEAIALAVERARHTMEAIDAELRRGRP